MEENKTIAIILDGIVIDVVKFSERFAALLMSNPTFIDITENNIESGWTYENGTFNKVIDNNKISIQIK